jgi:hypothetical protein
VSSGGERNPPDPAGDGPVTFETARRIALALPGMEEGTSYHGTPVFRVAKKFVSRLKEDGESLVVKVSVFERKYMLEAEPEVFHITDHYREYPIVLVRLAAIRPERLREVLEDAWRLVAPRRLVAEYDKRPPV